MINPTDCRELAKQCIELANNSGNDRFQSILFNMAHKWSHVAEFREQKVLSSVARKERRRAMRSAALAAHDGSRCST
jgi:hypothetical protein